MLAALDNNGDNKHVVPVANFLKCVVTEVLFSIVDSIITNVLLITTVK